MVSASVKFAILILLIKRHLACNDGRPLLVTILDDLQEVAALVVVELFRPPVIKDQQVGLSQRFEDPAISAIAPH